ncbi:MAG TPA: hypothetical protein VGK10_02570 [Prolixibacteraceae bacterium]|jgi:hypothetical protein
MIIEVSAKDYRQHFCSDPHPFISEHFLELNKWKVEKLVRLISDRDKVSVGLVAGIENNMLLAPFSAPFGGFHYKNEHVFISEVEHFLEELEQYAKSQRLNKIFLSLPPIIYQKSFNSKAVNTLIRLGFEMLIPDITCWVDLSQYNCRFSYKMCRNNQNTAIRNKLTFNILTNLEDKMTAYETICDNRKQFNRKINMTFEEVMRTNDLWPIDFFGINDSEGNMVASAIFYQFPNNVAYGVFWGDNATGRSLKSMDFLSFNLWNHYKSLDYKFIDLSASTKFGIPNESLLRFKEIHECNCSLRFNFSLCIANSES